MQVEVQSLEDNRNVVHIEIPAEDVRRDYEKVLKPIIENTSLPGFRKGKVPRNLVEKHHVVLLNDELRRIVLPRALSEAIKEKELNVAALVNLEDMELSPETGLRCKVTMEMVPEFKLPACDKLPVEVKEIEVTEQMEEDYLEQLRSYHANFAEAEDDYAVAEGDLVKLDYQGFLDGNALEIEDEDKKYSAAGSDTWTMVDSNYPHPLGFREVLTGLKKNDETEFDQTFDESFEVESLQSKTVHYKITVKEIRKKNLSELDDEFAQGIGLESLEKLREQVRDLLLQRAKDDEGRRIRQEISDYLLRQAPFELSTYLLDIGTRQEVSNLLQQSIQSGVDKEKLVEEQEALVEAARSIAERKLKLLFVLLKVAGSENIEASEDEKQAMERHYARINKISVTAAREEINNLYGISNPENDIRANKAMDLLVSRVENG